MAGKRMLHSNICESDKLSAVSYQAEALYYRLLTRVDDNGNFTANPKVVYGQCMPLRDDMNPQKVKVLLEELASNGQGKEPLISFYESGKDHFLHITKFEDFQCLRPERVRANFPEPVGVTVSSQNRDFFVGVSKDKLSKENISKDKLSGQADFKNISTRYISFFGIRHSHNQKHLEKYSAACQKYGEDKVLDCFDRWAATADWVRNHKDRQHGLNFFYRPLEEFVAADEITSEREKPEPTEDLEAIKLAASAARQAESAAAVNEILERRNDPNRYEI